MIDVSRFVSIIRSDTSLSPVMQQVLVNRLSFSPTPGEIERARAQVMGKAPAASSS